MKVGAMIREKIVGQLKTNSQEASACFFVGLNRIAAFPLNTIRNDLRRSGGRFFLAKNTLLKRALDDSGRVDTDGFLGHETGVVFVAGSDAVKVCKVLIDFTKEHENVLELRGGYLTDKKITSQDMVDLAKLPSREVLLGMALGAMAAPLTAFLSSMNQVVLKFVWTMEEIKKKKA